MTMAKSPARRLNSQNPTRSASPSSGSRMPVITSVGLGRRGEDRDEERRRGQGARPRRRRDAHVAIEQATSTHHSEAGSAWATLPPNVPRVRIGR